MATSRLALLGAMTREIYESVYGLGGDQMVPQGAWRQVRDLAGRRDGRTPAAGYRGSAVAGRRSQKIWRPDNRGKPLIRELANGASGTSSRREQTAAAASAGAAAGTNRAGSVELLRAHRDSEAFLREAAIQRDMKTGSSRSADGTGSQPVSEGLPEDIGSKLRRLDEGIASSEAGRGQAAAGRAERSPSVLHPAAPPGSKWLWK